MMEWYHNLLHSIGHLIGHEIPGEAPSWLDPLLHVVLIWAPLALLAVLAYRLVGAAWRRVQRLGSAVEPSQPSGLTPSVFTYILEYTRADQARLIAFGLLTLPVLYATLELPKLIINSAIDAEDHSIDIVGYSFTQTEHLFLLCAFYLVAIFVNGALKYVLNVYKGKVGERLLRRLRLTVFHKWRRGAGSARRSEVIPILSQEVEPVGGFAADAFALPVFQGGTFLTILLFMFIQDPFLGAAALTLLPVQIAVIPRLQRKLNALSRRRVKEVRNLSGHLGEQAGSIDIDLTGLQSVGTSLKQMEAIRLEIHRTKFFMKAMNNFLSALTPFFFYSIGGYLVINGDLTLGALVAVLAAYKDFSSPLKEMFRYYQSMEDVRIRYDEVRRFLGQGVLVVREREDKSGANQNPIVSQSPFFEGVKP